MPHLAARLTELPLLLLGAVEALSAAAGYVLQPMMQERYDAAMATVLAALGPRAADAALTAGRALSLDEAVAEALAPAAPTETLRHSQRPDGLSAREVEVLALIAEGPATPPSRRRWC